MTSSSPAIKASLALGIPKRKGIDA